MVHIDQDHLKTISERARLIMENEQIEALVSSSCENFYYLSGYQSAFMYTLRMSEVALVILFRDPARKTVLIMNDFEAAGVANHLPEYEVRTYPTWVDVDDPMGLIGSKFQGKRPVSPQAEEMFGVLGQVLAEYGASIGKVAVELSSMRYPSVLALRKACPGISELVEASSIFTKLREIKTPWEIEQLRKACYYAEEGIISTIREIEVGISAAEIVETFRKALMRYPGGSTARFHMVSVGANFAPAHVFDTRPSKLGDLIKFDVGVEVAGYGSDIARTFVLGPPSDMVKRIYDALRVGHDRLLQIIEPGMTMKTAFDEGMNQIRSSGLTNYNRGHLGHSAGLSLAAEEAPFISPSEETVFRPGMVICLETPYYGHGLGSIMIEDMVLVTDNGCERLNRLTTDLISL
ncbi:M24 family metallopeptidase [Paenibacillus frigoriresistens]|uniref:M24 family metallopeptidase n=1 Tax=Paenibacillus alginolyticus TaxID=59839 RepID=UPI00156584F9|nr:M24 family metallopeptidase [Paenibacillus frigoriresistens]NRF95929.1 M24 family metallopeptidase [Paenibacillus frigoriresistens]